MSEVWVLRFTNDVQERYYFVRLEMKVLRQGVTRNLIAETTPDISKAKPFDTCPEALAAWKEAGEPLGWEAVVKP